MKASSATAQAGDRKRGIGPAIFSGFCASFVGLGLARFGYTPLLPAIIQAHWFQPSTAAYLGAANLAGYLLGALTGRPLASRWAAAPVLRAMMLVIAGSFLACAFRLGFSWFFVSRLASGWAGGTLMVLAATTVLPHVAPARRGLAGGVIFMGIGMGIACSGTLIPLLLSYGLRKAWLGLCVITLVLTVTSWPGWPEDKAKLVPSQPGRTDIRATPLRALYVEYGLNAVGLVPHMLFLVDFVVRGLGDSLRTGSDYWVLFGLGAIAGPVVNGHLADRIGFGRLLRISFLVQLVAVLLPALSTQPVAIAVSSFVVGAFTPGMVTLVLGRIHELLAHHPAAQRAAWSKATVSFALFQAAAAYGFSFLFSRDNDYQALFLIAASALVAAFAIDVAFNRVPKGA